MFFSPLSLTPTLSLRLLLPVSLGVQWWILAWQGHGGGIFFFAESLFLSVLTLSLISHLSFSFKACIGVGLGSWLDLGMVVGWDRLMVGLDQRGLAGWVCC